MRTIFISLLTLIVLAIPAPALAVDAAAGYGEYRLVEDTAGRLWTRAEWEEQGAGRTAKSYGYLTQAGDRPAAVWREFDDKGAVVREAFILDGAVALRDLGRYFPALAGELAASGEVFVVRSYRRDGLAALLPHPAGNRLVNFIMADGKDRTRPNTHTLIRGYTVAAPTAAEREGWTKVDNFFTPGLHFSEALVKRRHTDLIVVHHTKIEDMTVASIHDHHLRNGWAGIGYHKVVLPDGTVADGRPEAAVGAHAYGVNRRSVGVVVVGDFDVRQPSAAQLAALTDVVTAWAVKYRLNSDQVVGHRDVFARTTCPGRQFPWEEFKQALAAKLGR